MPASLDYECRASSRDCRAIEVFYRRSVQSVGLGCHPESESRSQVRSRPLEIVESQSAVLRIVVVQ